jgi:hypothetical protein
MKTLWRIFHKWNLLDWIKFHVDQIYITKSNSALILLLFVFSIATKRTSLLLSNGDSTVDCVTSRTCLLKCCSAMERPLWLHYSGFQPSVTVLYKFTWVFNWDVNVLLEIMSSYFTVLPYWGCPLHATLTPSTYTELHYWFLYGGNTNLIMTGSEPLLPSCMSCST